VKILFTATNGYLDDYLDVLNKYNVIYKKTYYSHIEELKIETNDLVSLLDDLSEKIEHPLIFNGKCINDDLWYYWIEIYDDYRE